jgi:hypothetical protein
VGINRQRRTTKPDAMPAVRIHPQLNVFHSRRDGQVE